MKDVNSIANNKFEYSIPQGVKMIKSKLLHKYGRLTLFLALALILIALTASFTAVGKNNWYSVPDYFQPGAVELAMANDMVDTTASELAGEPRTQAWFYSTWDGRFSSFEPMIALEYLKTLQSQECSDIMC
jgi:hypothetical protein